MHRRLLKTLYTMIAGWSILPGLSAQEAGGAAVDQAVEKAAPDTARVKEILTQHCYRCHGEKGAAEGGMNYVLQRDRLVAAGKVTLKQPDRSTLLTRIVSKEMPADDLTTVGDDEIKILRDWIAVGAPDFNPPAKPRTTITRDTRQSQMLDNLKLVKARDREFQRFITITHLHNAGRSDEELQTAYNAMLKFINSLSWGRTIVIPAVIDRERTIYRFDLRDLQWNPTIWNRLAGHTLQIEPDSETARELARITKTRFYELRADQLIAIAAEPENYHFVLGIPTNVIALETRLGVNVARNRLEERLLRAGFAASGVSNNSRMIERHESSFGAYWKSYDFASNQGKSNLFERPLGPGRAENQFQHDGGEIIFNLPNGLQGYMLIDRDGNRIDKGPLNIVSDPNSPDRTVINGISCMGCHARGMIPKDDQIAAHVTKNEAAYPIAERGAIFNIYRPVTIKRKLDEDAARFRAAVEACSIPFSKSEPISYMFKQSRADLELASAVAEAETDDAVFRRVIAKNTNLGRQLGPLLVAGGTIKRDTFIAAFSTLQQELGRQSYEPLRTQLDEKLPLGINDEALLFTRTPRDTAQLQMLRFKAETGADLTVETLSEIPEELLPEYSESDSQGRLEALGRLVIKRRNEMKQDGYYVLIVRGPLFATWSITTNRGQIPRDERTKLFKAVEAHFLKLEWDAGLEVFTREASALLRRFPPPRPPAKATPAKSVR